MFLEREGGLAAVTDAVREARKGNGSLLLVTGAVGAGRTTFLGGLPTLVGRDSADEGIRVLRANGAWLEQDHSLGVVHQLLDPVMVASPKPARERWLQGADACRPLFTYRAFEHDVPESEYATPEALRGLLALVRNLSADTPLLILVDDLQWVDAASLRWLGLLSEHLAGTAATVVLALREGVEPVNQEAVRRIVEAATRVLPLGPLGIASTRVLVHAEFYTAGQDEFVWACQTTSGGNPLFLVSLLASLAARGVPPTAEGAALVRTSRPERLRARFTACLMALPLGVRDVAQAMSVLGELTDRELLCRLLGITAEACAEALTVLSRLGLLAAGLPHRFCHPVVQEAVEQVMSATEREHIQLNAALLLHDSGRSAEQTATHLLATMSQGDDRATAALRSAATDALDRGAPVLAAHCLRRALQVCPPDGADRAALLVDLATAEREFDSNAAIRHVMQALPLLSSAYDRALAVSRIAPLLLVGVSERARNVVERAAADLGTPDALTGQTRDLALRLKGRLSLVNEWAVSDLFADVDALGEPDARPDLSTGGARELATALLHTGTVRLRLPARVVADMSSRLLAAERPDFAHVHTLLPMLTPVLLAADAVQRAVPWLDVALNQARLRNSLTAQVGIRCEQALVHIGLGDLRAAKAMATEAWNLADDGWSDGLGAASVTLAAVALETGDVQLGEAVLERTSRRAGAYPRVGRNAVLLLLRGFLVGRTDPRGGLGYVLDCGQLLEDAGWTNPVLHPWRKWAATSYLKLGDLDSAHRLADEDHALAVRWGAPAAMGSALLLRGMLAGGAEGVDLTQRAVDVLAGSASALLRAKALTQLGGMLRADGDPRADQVLRDGRDLATRCGADWLARRATAHLAGADRGTGRLELTHAELRVARLVVDGRTNREIADELAVALRTVEKHLTSAYRKLEVSGRAALADGLRSADGDDREPAQVPVTPGSGWWSR
ncbi:ATP-binding protein [Umezawaea tangerina]|uniref:Regulatory LuxR family protein n=1 Tax=Umezawaea tangerina TaxID=84725 RepID=A0A2T0T1U5_9PSEU|nr:LuxR family transcriptional regulator [Umezawaea tangerina]PRY39619.1 regulatory LuxR family protein [Umezawaea tangerina]